MMNLKNVFRRKKEEPAPVRELTPYPTAEQPTLEEMAAEAREFAEKHPRLGGLHIIDPERSKERHAKGKEGNEEVTLTSEMKEEIAVFERNHPQFAHPYLRTEEFERMRRDNKNLWKKQARRRKFRLAIGILGVMFAAWTVIMSPLGILKFPKYVQRWALIPTVAVMNGIDYIKGNHDYEKDKMRREITLELMKNPPDYDRVYALEEEMERRGLAPDPRKDERRQFAELSKKIAPFKQLTIDEAWEKYVAKRSPQDEHFATHNEHRALTKGYFYNILAGAHTLGEFWDNPHISHQSKIIFFGTHLHYVAE